MKYVYLAGPILGCTEYEAKNWRQYAHDVLIDHGIVGISPLRCEPIDGSTYEIKPRGRSEKWHSPQAIGGKNFFDMDYCQMCLMNFPAREPGRDLSAGTLIELGALKAWNKRTVICTQDPLIEKHSVVRYCADWVMPTLDDALDVVIGLMGGYHGGKNV